MIRNSNPRAFKSVVKDLLQAVLSLPPPWGEGSQFLLDFETALIVWRTKRKVHATCRVDERRVKRCSKVSSLVASTSSARGSYSLHPDLHAGRNHLLHNESESAAGPSGGELKQVACDPAEFQKGKQISSGFRRSDQLTFVAPKKLE